MIPNNNIINVKKNDWVTPINFDKEFWGYGNKPLGYPQQVKHVDWPFMLLGNLDGSFISVDLRTITLKKVSQEYVEEFISACEGSLRRYVPMTERTSMGVERTYGVRLIPDIIDEPEPEYVGSPIEKTITDAMREGPKLCPRCESYMSLIISKQFTGKAYVCQRCNFIQDLGDPNE